MTGLEDQGCGRSGGPRTWQVWRTKDVTGLEDQGCDRSGGPRM